MSGNHNISNIKVFLGWHQFLPDSIEFMCRTKREIANAANKIWHWEQSLNQKGKMRFLPLHKAVFQTNTKMVRFIVIVFGQMLSGHQDCSPSPPFFRSTQYCWSESERKMMNYQWIVSQALSNPDMNDDSAWHSSGAYMRADVWLYLLGIFLCRLFWSSAFWSESLCYVSALRLSAESSSVRLRTPPLSFYLWDDRDRLFISKSKTQYCL